VTTSSTLGVSVVPWLGAKTLLISRRDEKNRKGATFER
jgi:hypothetical protein